MLIHYDDFNGAESLMKNRFAKEWEELESILRPAPLFLKASDQDGLNGSLIFDPVGTNEHLHTELTAKKWHANLPIPSEFDFLGKDIDFFKNGVLVEVQFSNYPFLLNNVVRSELFSKASARFAGQKVDAVVIVTKAKMFPASQSTLYFEQAVKQVEALARRNVFDVPMRIVGLFEQIGQVAEARWTEYAASRYSRTVVRRVSRKCNIAAAQSTRGRCTLTLKP